MGKARRASAAARSSSRRLARYALKVGKLSLKQPAITLNVIPMSPEAGQIFLDHHRLLTVVMLSLVCEGGTPRKKIVCVLLPVKTRAPQR
jgi:hypothetical protein